MAENDLADALSDRALDAVDTVVATVNDKAIRPAIVAARVDIPSGQLFGGGFDAITIMAGFGSVGGHRGGEQKAHAEQQRTFTRAEHRTRSRQA